MLIGFQAHHEYILDYSQEESMHGNASLRSLWLRAESHEWALLTGYIAHLASYMSRRIEE